MPDQKDGQSAPKIITKERIAKYLCTRGICSRRKAEELIEAGQIVLNKRVVTTPVTFVNPSVDEVTVEGKIVPKDSPDKVYILLNKPRCVVTSLNDPEGRSTVKDYLKGIHERVFPIGRLDYLSEGLLLLTNDGDYAQKIMHPQYGVIKTYEVKIFGHVTPDMLSRLRAGIKDENGHLLVPKKVRPLQVLPNKTWLEFQLEEGKNREIRKICAGVGLTIDKLRRVAIGGINSWNLASGKYHILTKKEAYSALSTKTEEHVSSPRESIKLKSFKTSKKFHPANDKSFFKFRPEHYQATMKSRVPSDPRSGVNHSKNP